MSTTSSREPPVPLRWQEHRSEHFVFSFVSGFRVENTVMSLAARLEAVRDATAEALDLEELPDEPIRVYLLTYAPGEQGLEESDGQRDNEARERHVLAVRLSDAPGMVLERALVELLLTTSLNVRVNRLLVDGVLGYVALWIGDSDPTELNAALTRLQSEGRPISLAAVRMGPTGEAKQLYHQVVTSFVAFLLITYGPDSFKQFVREFDPDVPDRASEAAYGRSIADLEKEWLASLRQTQPGAPGPALRQAPGPSQPPAPGQMRPSTPDEPQPPAPGVKWFFRGAFSYLRTYWGREVLILLATVISAALGIVLPLAFGAAIDALTSGDYSYLRLLVLGLVALFIIEVPATMGQQYLSVNVAANVMKDMQYNMFSHLQRLSTDFYTRTRPGEITSRFTNDLGLMNMALTQTLPMMATLAVTFIGSLVSLFFLQGWLALMVVLVLPLLLILPARLGGRAARAVHETQRNRAMVASTIQENVGAQQVIKAYRLQEPTLSRFRDQLDRLNRSVVRGGFLSALPGITADISMSLIQLLSLTGGVILVYYNQLEIGALVSFQLLLGGVTAPMMSITSIYQMLLQSSVGMQRVSELLDERPQIVDAPDAKTLERFSEEIRFEDVGFSYTGEQMNLRDANLTIPAGQYVAFVGPSGSGKSTLLNLIMRFYDPDTGTVTMDGQDLRQVTQESLRSQIGTVFQDTFLYNATVRENITLGKTDATEEIEAAARAAEIHDFLLTLPQGYDTEVGERGAQLSGGQRQRIALARAILYDPPILVLDEPTSALDPQTEAAVNATLHEQGRGRTVITVTHRLASVADADRIFVLERGQVVEQGTHEELLHAQGLYHRLWGQQNGFADAERVGVEASRLRAIPLFENLDEALLSALEERFVRERCVEGQTIFEEGDPGDKLYFVDRGEVEVLISDPVGEERCVALLRDGEYFGEIALMEDVPRTATVRTRVPSTLLVLDRERFLDLLRAAPSLRAAFERGVEERCRVNLTVLEEAARVEGLL